MRVAWWPIMHIHISNAWDAAAYQIVDDLTYCILFIIQIHWEIYFTDFRFSFISFPMKFHIRYLSHTLKYVPFIHWWKSKNF